MSPAAALFERKNHKAAACASVGEDAEFDEFGDDWEWIFADQAFREMRDYYRSLGFQFALDDTGAGYAGLEELLEIEPDYIKIDRAMVSGVDQDPARQDVLSAVLTLADKMGSQVIGEGLDTIEELEIFAAAADKEMDAEDT